MAEYELIRSKRKTIAIYVRPGGAVEVRAPHAAAKAEIDAFVRQKKDWIEQTGNRLAAARKSIKRIPLSSAEVVQLKEKAETYIRGRCSYYAEKMGVKYEKISITKAKTRWGSCSSRGNISFAYRLMLTPLEAIDYVIVHELAHLKELNHSSKFWNIVERTMPDYRERKELLRAFQMDIEIVETE